MTRNPSDHNEHLPPWLRGVPLPPRPNAPAAAGFLPSAAAAPPAQDEVPDWLRSASPSPAAPAQDEVPDWLRGSPAASTTPPSAPADEVPDWLRGAADAAPAAPAQDEVPDWLRGGPTASATPPSTPAQDEVPDWLRGAADAAPVTPAQDEVPDWLRGAPTASATPPSAPADAVPDWLSGAADAAPAAPAQDEVPDWLRPPEPSESPAPSPVSFADLWSDPPAAPAQPPAAPTPSQPPSAAGQDEDGVPSWLRDVSMDEVRRVMESDSLEGISATPFTFEGASGPSTAQPSSDAPSWLGGTGSESSSWLDTLGSGTSSASPEQEPDAPSWLRDLGPSAPAPSTPPTPAASFVPPVDEAPSWLQGGEQPNAAATPPAADPSVPDWLNASAPSAPAAPAGDEGVPAWLRDSSPAADADVPDWLNAGAPSAAAPVAPADEGVPPWLREAAPSAPATPSPSGPAVDEGIPSWLREAEPAVTAAPAQDADVPSWLREAAPSAPATPPPSSPASDEGIPPWLREAAPSAPAAPSPSAPAADEGIPAWLREAAPAAPADPATDEGVPAWLREAAPSAPVAPVPSTSPADEGVPPWLRESAAPPAAPAADEGVPSWLREAVPATPPAPAAPSAGAGAEDVPSWLRESAAAPAEDVPAWLNTGPAAPPVAPASPSAGASTPPPAAPEVPDWLNAEIPAPTAEDQSDLPVWLRQAEPAGGTRQTPPPVAPPVQPVVQPPLQPSEAITAPLPNVPSATPAAGPGEDLPPWLRDESGAPLPTAGAPGDAGLPTWLRGATLEGATPAQPAQPPQQPTAPNLNWFDDTPAASSAQGAPASESEFLGATDLPAWLRATTQQPEAPAPEVEPADARSLDWLRRLGGQEEEAPVAVAAPVARLAPPVAPARSESHLMAVALLERLAASPFPEAAPLPEAAQPTRWERIGLERVLYVVLLVVLLAALAVPALSAPFQVAPAEPSAARLQERISQLGPEDVVLVGSEWDVRRVGELRPLQQAVMGQLIEQRVKMVLVSTNPQGSLLLYDLRDELARAGYLPGASDYILLGYRPGGELALRLLAQDLRGALRSDAQGLDTTQGGLANGVATKGPLNSIRDFSMILVLADDAASVQGWMEQVYPTAPQVPIGLIQPAETGALTQPYTRLPNVFSLTGKSGALAYNALRQDGAVQQAALQGSGQFRLALLVFAVLFVLGGVVVGVGSTAKRRKKAA
ncbi:MAG: hypothetical protein OHK0022_31830 [Roseiflexaceae bacterium]